MSERPCERGECLFIEQVEPLMREHWRQHCPLVSENVGAVMHIEEDDCVFAAMYAHTIASDAEEPGPGPER